MGKNTGALADVDADADEVTDSDVDKFLNDLEGGDDDGGEKSSAKGKDKGKSAADEAEDEDVDTDTETEDSEDGSDDDSDEEESTDDEEESDTDTETASKKAASLLKKHGLDKQFKNITDLVSRVPEMNRQIEHTNTQLRLSNSLNQALMARLEALDGKSDDAPPAKKEPLDKEAFLEELNSDPEGAFVKMAERLGYVKKDQLSNIENSLTKSEIQAQRSSLASVVADIPGCGEVAKVIQRGGIAKPTMSPQWKAIVEEFALVKQGEHPVLAAELASLPDNKLIPILWDRVKGKFGKDGGKPPVGKVPAGKKVNAQSDAGKGKRPAAAKSGTEPDFSKMSTKEIFEWHKKRGLVS